MSDAEAQQYGERSNEIEMLYINSAIRTVTDAGTLSVIAHEFVHLIQSGYDSDEMWIEESLAELGMLANGYYTDAAWVNNFLSNPNYSLTGESAYSVNYGACLLWSLYLYEQIDVPTLFQQIVIEPLDGIDGLESVFAANGANSFHSYYFNWLFANYLDDPILADGQYGYVMIDIQEPATTVITTYPSTFTPNIHSYGARYYRLEQLTSNSVGITITAENYQNIYFGIIANATTDTPDISSFIQLTGSPYSISYQYSPYATLSDVTIIMTSDSAQAQEAIELKVDNY